MLEPEKLGDRALRADTFCLSSRQKKACFWFAGILCFLYLTGISRYLWPHNDAFYYLKAANTWNMTGSLIKNKGLFVMLLGTLKQWGVSEQGISLMVLLIGMTGFVAIWWTWRLLTNDTIAWVTTLSYMCCFSVFNNTHRIMTDSIFVSLFFSGVVFSLMALKRHMMWFVLGGLFFFLSVGVRPSSAAFLIIFAGAWGLEGLFRKSRNWRQVVLGILIFMVSLQGVAVTLIKTTSRLAAYVAGGDAPPQGFHEAILLPRVLSRLLYEQISMPAFGIVLILLALYGGTLFARRRTIMPLVLFTGILALFSMTSRNKMIPRYLLPLLPVMIPLVFVAVWDLVKRMAPLSFTREKASRLIVVMLSVAFACNCPHIFRNSFYYARISDRDEFYQAVSKSKYPIIQFASGIKARQAELDPIFLVGDWDRYFTHFSGYRLEFYGSMAPNRSATCLSKEEKTQLLGVLKQRGPVILSLDKYRQSVIEEIRTLFLSRGYSVDWLSDSGKHMLLRFSYRAKSEGEGNVAGG